MDKIDRIFAGVSAEAEEAAKLFGKERRKAIEIFEDCLCYDFEEVKQLYNLSAEIRHGNSENKAELIKQFISLRDSMKKLDNAPERIYLYDGQVPTITEYTDFENYKYNHAPDFKPYMHEFLTDKPVKGAVLVVPGGDHGECVTTEGYGVCKQLNEMGYHAFMLLNRPNHNPWRGLDVATDCAKAIQIIRANADKYNLDVNRVAIAGFSNGGITSEYCIQYYSKGQKISDWYKDYKDEKYDGINARPNAFLCIYGPRFDGLEFDWTNVDYPATFFAVGKDDGAMKNLHWAYPDLINHGVDVEVHTFCGTPHGWAGKISVEDEIKYPNFELWLPLADYFMTYAFNK